MLLDADDPVSDSSLLNAIATIKSSQSDYVIGDRRAILLHSEDQVSSYSRIYVEIFSNTLLQVTLQKQWPIFKHGPDIQSGFYIISGRARRSLCLDYVKDYGGELALYYELTMAGFSPSTMCIESNKATSSSYLIHTIVRSIASLPFFQSVSQEQLAISLRLAPELYARYLPPGEQQQFFSELIPVLRDVFPWL
ncbi:hypothetical protein ACO0K9_09910 [Undibacterium sp. Ji50W]|uniref:hypothetical protein n=1 Tax=Undibacterium sp. Ji50W TaxID=3413041 RepID=UPI003BF28045